MQGFEKVIFLFGNLVYSSHSSLQPPILSTAIVVVRDLEYVSRRATYPLLFDYQEAIFSHILELGAPMGII